MICSCCYDEANEIWCGCEEVHDGDEEVLKRYADPDKVHEVEQWSFTCENCDRYTSGTGYYTD